MKGIIGFIVLVCAVALHAGAQDWKVNYGVSIGLTRPGYALGNISSSISREASPTYNGQLNGLIRLSPSRYFGLESGLSLHGSGAILEWSEFGNREVVQHTYWLQMPVNLVGMLPLRDSSHFFLKVGAYGGYGLFGKNYIPDSYDGSAKRDFIFGRSGTQQRTDYGLQAAVGYRLRSGYFIAVGYQRGLRNVAPEQAAYEQRNRAYTVTIGYQF